MALVVGEEGTPPMTHAEAERLAEADRLAVEITACAVQIAVAAADHEAARLSKAAAGASASVAPVPPSLSPAQVAGHLKSQMEKLAAFEVKGGGMRPSYDYDRAHANGTKQCMLLATEPTLHHNHRHLHPSHPKLPPYVHRLLDPSKEDKGRVQRGASRREAQFPGGRRLTPNVRHSWHLGTGPR